MVWETFEQTGNRVGVITRIARQLGIGPESLRSWVRQAEADGGHRPATSTQNKERIAPLEREVARIGGEVWSLGGRDGWRVHRGDRLDDFSYRVP
jgi:transposase